MQKDYQVAVFEGGELHVVRAGSPGREAVLALPLSRLLAKMVRVASGEDPVVAATLEAALEVLGDREAAVCIELTKLHERVSRGYLSDLVREYADAKVKGEVALVIAGSNPKFRRASGPDGTRAPRDMV